MDTKAELITWNDACRAFDSEDYELALELFERIADTAKIQFNFGLTLAALQNYDAAISVYDDAIDADRYFAIAYFQRGVASFLLGEFEQAVEDFTGALLCMRENDSIDYTQLGLDYKLYSCEVIYNRGLCLLFMDDEDAGMADLLAARARRQTEDHELIDVAVEEGIDGLSVFALPPGTLFRPPMWRVPQNVPERPARQVPKLIATVSPEDAHTSFLPGPHRRKMQQHLRPDCFSLPTSPMASEGSPRAVQRKGSIRMLNRSPGPPRTSSHRGPIRGARSAPPLDEDHSWSGQAPSDAGRERESVDSWATGSARSEYSNGGRELRLRCHYHDVRVIGCDPSATLDEISAMVQRKFRSTTQLTLKYRDEDSQLVTLLDDEDLRMATAYLGRDNKLDIFCYD